MAFTYDLLTHNELGVRPDSIQQHPALVVAVWPFTVRDTYNRLTHRSVKNVDYMAVEEPIFLDKFCVNVKTTSSKRSHTSQAQLALIDDGGTLFKKMAPGDWMMVWMLADEKQAEIVRKKIREGKPANSFMDGLKFVGKISGLNRSIKTNTQNGIKTRIFTIAGAGFTEFDASIYFDPALNLSDASGIQFFARLTVGLSHVTAQPTLSVQGAIPSLVDIFLGVGPNPEVKLSQGLPSTVNTNFLVPAKIGKVLGRMNVDPEAPSLTYSSMLACYYGIQEYPGNLNNMISPGINGFFPRLKHLKGLHYECLQPLVGRFNPQISPWPGVPIWGILSQFLNPTVNEMYTCLKVAPDGSVLPTLVVRQIPFTTDNFEGRQATEVMQETITTEKSQEKDPVTGLIKVNRKIKSSKQVQTMTIPHTRFTSLPRWKVDPVQEIQYDVAKSNALRSNFVQVRGISPLQGVSELAIQRARVPPIADEADIARSGMSPIITTTNIAIASSFQGSLGDVNNTWVHLTADRLMGGHLRYSGMLTTMGIVEPICEGDNVEYDNLIFHIEQVSHTYMCNPQSGLKSFNTVLYISNGIPTSGEVAPDLRADEAPKGVSATPPTNFDEME